MVVESGNARNAAAAAARVLPEPDVVRWRILLRVALALGSACEAVPLASMDKLGVSVATATHTRMTPHNRIRPAVG
jgi:hypothetical protein